MILLAISANCTAFVFSRGLIPVQNYQRADYDFGTQNWDMTQDHLGKVYVANYNGMLTFDGQRWRQYYLPNYSTVRCLLYDNEADRIYAGGTEEFGYFYPDEITGQLQYQSLSQSLPGNGRDFSEVWDIIRVAGNIIFRCDNCLFEYKGTVEKLNIPGRIACSTLIGRKVMLGMEDGKVYSLKDGNFGSLKEEGHLPGHKIVAILPYDDNSIIACTPIEGLFILQQDKYFPLQTEYSDYLKDHQIFCGTYKNGIYVYGTVTGGALVWDTNTNSRHLINKESGMKNNTVLKSRFDRDANLWLCLDNGVAYVALDSPCRRLIGESNFIGAGYTSAEFEDKFLAGTNQGLYISENALGNSNSNYEMILQGQVWSITRYDGGLFISTDSGLFQYEGSDMRKVEGVPGVFKTLTLPFDPNHALASTYDSFYLLEKTQSGWNQVGKISGSQELKGNFLIDEFDRVWLSHWQKGIYILPFNNQLNRFTSCKIFDKINGLPANDNNTFSFFEGKPISSTYGGIFDLSPENWKAQKNEDLSKLIREERKGHLLELSDGSLVLIDDKGLTLIRRNDDDILEKKEISGPGLYHEIIPGFTDVQRISPDELIISTQTGFTLVNTKDRVGLIHSSKPFVSTIYANHDSLIYQAPLSLNNVNPIKVDHNLNSLRFDFAYPECSFGENTEFSTYLENYDKGWSPFSGDSSREYTRLSDGKYVLHLKVRDNYSGEVLESSLGFTVSPPWFRTPWAKGVYTAISFAVLFLLFISVRKKMIQIRRKIEKNKEKELEDLRKESERDAMLKDMEIAGLKTEQLEQEIKHKSDELSTTTMSLISKNEILRDIGNQISKIQKMVGEVSPVTLQKNLSKLQASIEENIGKDTDWNTFNKSFDVVYGDYMKRLLALHPSLSQSEKRLCCYIRMGLSSKEIAPLINISFRSVEMARYRLRKKMNLAPEAILSDYLAGV